MSVKLNETQTFTSSLKYHRGWFLLFLSVCKSNRWSPWWYCNCNYSHWKRILKILKYHCKFGWVIPVKRTVKINKHGIYRILFTQCMFENLNESIKKHKHIQERLRWWKAKQIEIHWKLHTRELPELLKLTRLDGKAKVSTIYVFIPVRKWSSPVSTKHEILIFHPQNTRANRFIRFKNWVLNAQNV